MTKTLLKLGFLHELSVLQSSNPELGRIWNQVFRDNCRPYAGGQYQTCIELRADKGSRTDWASTVEALGKVPLALGKLAFTT